MREAFVPVDHEGSMLWTAGSQIKAPNTGCSVRPTRTGAAPSAASIKSGRFASQDFRDRSIVRLQGATNALGSSIGAHHFVSTCEISLKGDGEKTK